MKKGIQYVLCLCLTIVLISRENELYPKNILVGSLLSVFLFLCVLYVENAFDKLLCKKTDIWYMWVYVAILLAAYGLLVILAANPEVMQYTDIYVTIVVASACLTGAIGWLQWFEQKSSKVHSKLKNLETIHLDTEACYEKIKEHRRQISFLRHDMLNRIRNTTCSDSNGNQEETEYLVELIKQEIQKTTKFYYCEHPMIDIALTKRIQELQERNIFPDTEIRLTELGELDYIQMNRLIHLLFDHVEGCIGGDCRMRLRIYNDRKFHGRNRIYIYISMSTKMRLLELSGTKYLHEARRLAKKMGGSLDYEHEKDAFIIGGILEVEK